MTGWWRERPGPGRVESRARYARVIGLQAPDVEIDLRTPISTGVDVRITSATEVEVR